jgi:mono/diheme cytochrome c family protein
LTRLRRSATAAALLGSLALGGASRGNAGEEPPDGAALFEARCAVCHGLDGRGAPGVELFGSAPDFSDCRFAAREADADWLAVVHRGGPARGFRALMPAFAGALSEAELRAVVSHLRSFCRDERWPRGELNLPRALVTEKAFPEDEAVVTTFANVNRAGDVETELLYERRVGQRGQLELALPIAARETSQGWSAGLGDLALGAKYAFLHDFERGSIASLGGELLLPTGNADSELGKGAVVFEPYLAVGQILPRGSFAQLQLLGEIPSGAGLDPEIQLRAALGASFAWRRFGRAFAPMLELIGAFPFAEGADTQWDLLPQLQVTLSRRQHLRLDVGVRVPLSDAATRPTRVGAYLLWDWFDGGLLEGW